MVITHGILCIFNTVDELIHEIKIISDYDAKIIPKKINWKETEVSNNSNRERRK